MTKINVEENLEFKNLELELSKLSNDYITVTSRYILGYYPKTSVISKYYCFSLINN